MQVRLLFAFVLSRLFLCTQFIADIWQPTGEIIRHFRHFTLRNPPTAATSPLAAPAVRKMSAARRRRAVVTVEKGGDEAAPAAQGSDGGARMMVNLVAVPPAAPSVSQHMAGWASHSAGKANDSR